MSDGAATTAASAWRFKVGGLRWVPLALLIILLDQATKAVVESRFELFDVKPILPFLEFTLLYNTGAAFSFLAGASGWQRWFFIGLGVTVSIVILYWLKRLEPASQRLMGAGLALILGVGTRYAAALLAVLMLVTLIMVKVNVGLIAPQGAGAGAELDLALLAGCVALLLLGSGPLSIEDNVLRREL